MKVDNYEISVLHHDGVPFPEIEHNGHCYVVGQPGKPFRLNVRCRSIQKLRPYFRNQKEIITTVVQIDGTTVGICKRLTEDCSSVLYEGFVSKQGEGTNKSRFCEFVFAQPSTSQGEAEAQPSTSEVGKIVVQVKHMIQIAPRVPQEIQFRVPASVKVPLAEGKKFFMSPSLAAQAGTASFKTVNWSQWQYADLRTLATIELRYETAATLLLRKILNPSNPQHAAIIQADAQAACISGAAANLPQAGVAGAAAVPNLKAEPVGRGVKRSRAEREADGEVVDLTAGPFIPRLAKQGEVLTCDLTGQPGQQHWKAEKKPVLSVLTV